MKYFTTNRLPVILFFTAFLSQAGAQHFLEYQDSAHIDHIFEHTAFLGGGAAFFDYDNDGDDDLYITAGNARDHFYENNGDGTFTNKSIEAGFIVTKLYYTTGVIAGDIDNDGFKDLFITTWFADFESPGKNLLYKNNGDGTFTEIWNHTQPGDKTQTMGATFIDFDLDGLLDIYAVSYVENAGFLYDTDGNIVGFDHDCYHNTFYHNLGNGQFEEIAGNLFLNDNGCALATTATDFDGDGDMDIYLANDFGEFVRPNKLFQNKNPLPNFTEVATQYHADARIFAMGIAVGDIDNDLDPDYYVTNFGKNILLKNDGTFFTDITDLSGTGDEWTVQDSFMAVGWGCVLLDIDNDTDLDLYVGNGYVPGPSFMSSQTFQNDKLFINNGDLTFTDTDTTLGIKNKFTTRGVSYSDYDNDGDLDILAVVENVPVSFSEWSTVLYNNQYGNQKNWLQVSLEGRRVNRDAYGSKIYLYADDKVLLQEISGGSSHASHVSARAHFGLGSISHVDSLKIIWTGGNHQQTIYDIAANQHLYIVEDTTTTPIVYATENAKVSTPYRIFPNPTKEKLTIRFNGMGRAYSAAIKLTNLMGEVLDEKIKKPETETVFIDTVRFPNGVYFIYLTINNGEVYGEKVIIAK